MRLVSITFLLSSVCLTVPTRAQDITWREEWPRFSLAEGVVTGTLAAGTVAGMFLLPQQEDSWSGGILFDDAVRDATRIQSRNTRDSWVLRGDLTFYGMTVFPFLDATFGAWLGDANQDVMTQLLLIDLQAMSMAGFVSVWTQKLAGRERPIIRECGSDPDYDKDCSDEVQRNQSFISGHTAMSFTGAGLICIQHAKLPLYGGGVADALVCGLGLGAASFVGVSRLISDRHYASDLLAGVLVGGTAGFLLPAWWHFGVFDMGKGPAKTKMAIAPLASPEVLGVALTGVN